MSRGHIKRAKNNQHFVDLREDFPRVTVKEIAKKLGCEAASVYMWCSEGKRYSRIPPIWTVDAIAAWRKELEAEKAARRGVNPVPEPVTAPRSLRCEGVEMTVKDALGLIACMAFFFALPWLLSIGCVALGGGPAACGM